LQDDFQEPVSGSSSMNNYSDLFPPIAPRPPAAGAERASRNSRRSHASRGGKPGQQAAGQWREARKSEVCETLPFDVFHWAAVSFVIAMTGGVLSYAAGTPALAAVANAFCYVFTVIAGALALAGYLAPRGKRTAGEPGRSDTATVPRAD
jgi:hypothetical protein